MSSHMSSQQTQTPRPATESPAQTRPSPQSPAQPPTRSPAQPSARSSPTDEHAAIAHAREARDRAEQRVSEVAGHIRSEAARAADSARVKAAGEIRAFGAAASAAAGQLEHEQHARVGDYVRGASTGCERFADYLTRSDLSEIGEDAAAFARRNPALFIGGAALIGFGVGRLLSAAPPARQPDETRTHRDQTQPTDQPLKETP